MHTRGPDLQKFVAPEIIFGLGALHLAGQYGRNLGGSKALVASDPGVLAAGWVQQVLASVGAAGLKSILFTRVTPNPRIEEVAAGAIVCAEQGCDIIIAVGGGSAIDCAKCIGLVAANQGGILDFVGVDNVGAPMPPTICIPTTAGTSADISQFAVIMDREIHRKLLIISKAVVPDISLVDPATLTTMDAFLTACTGMDALAHAVEAYVSLGHSPPTDIHALQAMRLISSNLQKSIAEPNNLEYRNNMMLASLEAGLAFSNASLGAAHAMAHSLGGLLDLPHGQCNALILDGVVDFNYGQAEQRYRDIATAMGIETGGMPSGEVRKRSVGEIRRLRETAGIHDTLSRCGVHRTEMHELAEITLQMTPALSPIHGGHVSGTLRSYMKNPSDNWEELRRKVLGLSDSSVRKTHYQSLRQRLAELERLRSELQQSEAELRQLIDAIPQHVLVLEPDGDHLYVNKVGLEYTGLNLEDTVGKDVVAKIFHPDDQERVLGERRRAVAHGVPWELEARIRGKDDKYRWFLTRISPLRDEQGRILRWYGTRTDIEDRKQAEEALRRSRAYLTEAQSLSHTGSFGWKPSTGEHLWSEETFRIFQYDPTTKPTVELVLQRVHPEDRALTQQIIERASQDGKDFEHEYRLLMPDGSIKNVHVVAHALSDASGGIEFVGAVMDVTTAKMAEDRIRRIINTVPGLLWSARPDGWIDFISQRWLDYTGMTLEQALGWGWLPAFHPDNLEQVLIKWRAALAAGKPFEAKTRFRRFDGEYRWFIGRAFPLLDLSGQILGWYGGDFDIDDRKLAEERIREQEIELREVLDLAPQHVAVLGADGSRLYLNRAALEYHGLTLEEWRSCDLRKLFHLDDWERSGEVQNALSSGSLFEIEARKVRHDGKYCWFLFRYKPLRDEQGRITRWAVAAIDIEDRKQAEERLRHENIALHEEIDKTSMFEEIVGTSSALQKVLSRLSKVAPTDSTVLITGETGTGKELVARAIHRRSYRSSRAFVSVNCAAIPRDLIASELFGHEKGAFTGATQRRLGRFELAEGGTIFLDEVGELPAETQIALLRVLQEHEFERVGGNRSIRTDVRVIAATNRDLLAAIVASTFRRDLFYRLNVFPIEIPPLRERREDIPLLVEYFIDRYARKAGKSIRRVNKKSLDLLESYPWPGNIRELQNVIERSVIVCETENFSVDESWLSRQPPVTEPKSQLEFSQALAAQEKEMIEAALGECGGRVFGPSGAAAKLGMPRSTLESKIRSLKINKNLFKTSRDS